MKKSTLAICIAVAGMTGCSKPEDVQEETAKEIIQEQTLAEPMEPAPLWLEEVEGEKALAQVQQWNSRTLEKLTSDPRFEEYQAEALEIVNATDKIAYGNMQGDFIYNFHQDENSKRGQLRRTTMESYQSDSPEWDVLLDIDKLNEAEGKNWVYKGSNCLEPEYVQCLVSLSDGGKDAVEVREWNHNDKAFVENGFYVPEAKSQVGWIDENTVVIGSNFGEGTLTESGYPRIAKLLSRGQSLEEARTIFEGEVSDVGAGVSALELEDGNKILIAYRYTTFYETEYSWLKGNEVIPLEIPARANPSGIFKGQLLVSLNEDWTINGETYASGALVSFDLDQWMKDQTFTNLQVVYQPDERSTLNFSARTKSKIVLSTLENVIGKLYAVDLVDGKWTREELNIPGTGTINVSSINDKSDIIFANQNTFITPNQQFAVDVVENTAKVIKSAPARFDATGLMVEQKQAESTDGTLIPYFVIRKEDTPMDGTTPTLLYAYGGFQVSLTPSYSGIRGKLWLENGGAYVLANIRGGGEFGPKWHQAGLKTNRQTIYDDMIAVGEDLVETKLTSPDKLGIMGGSNGGLLMGVMYNQRPDLWAAVVCQVPLLDMLRYHTLLAGASWVGEYGSPEVPAERAFLESISPLHNVNQEGEYPPIFFVTSTKDDRVHPGHARKMAYVLEQYNHPFEYYENIDGGHSASADLSEMARRVSLEYIFLSQELMD